MGIEENKEVVRRYFEELCNKGNFSVSEEIISRDYIVPQAPDGKGIGGGKLPPAVMRAGFPDIHVTIDSIVAEEDTVAARISLTGTHTGQYVDLAPTGKKVSFIGAMFFRLKDSKITEAILISAGHQLRQQLGLLPPTDFKVVQEFYKKLLEEE